MKTILITGASGGFGEAIAKTLAKQNVNLILTARNEKALLQVCDEIRQTTQSQVLPLVFDVRDFQACEKAIQSIPENMIKVLLKIGKE